MAQGINNHLSRGDYSNQMDARRRADAEAWEKMLGMINKTTPDTLLGYGLGKLLRGAWDHWNDRRAEKATENNGTDIQVGGTSTPVTIGGMNPDVVTRQPSAENTDMQVGMETPKTIGGLLGDGFTKTKVESTAPNGEKNSVTTTQPFTFSGNGGNLVERAAAQQAAMDNFGFNQNMLLDSLRRPRFY